MARAIASSRGFSINFVDAEIDTNNAHTGNLDGVKLTAMTTKDMVYLTTPNPQWSDDMWDHWWATFYHELGHHDPRCMDAWDLYNKDPKNLDPDKVNPGSLLGFAHNLWEDERSERITHKDYVHKEQVYDRQHPKRAAMLADRVAEQDLAESTHDYLSVITMVAANMQQRTDSWQAGCHDAADKFYKLLPDRYKDYFNQLIDEGYMDEVTDPGHKTAQQTLDFTKKILEEVFEIPPEENNPPPPPPPSGAGGGGGSGDGEGDGESDNPSRGMTDEEKETLKEFLESGGHDHDYKPEEMTEHEIKEMMNNGHHVRYENYDPKEWIEYHMIPDENLVLIDMKKKTVATFANPSKNIKPFNEVVGHVNHRFMNSVSQKSSNSFVNTVRRYLQVETRKRYKFNQKKGRIHGKALYKAGLPEESFDGRVFKNKKESKAKDSAVTLLVDCSGSMDGDKFELACVTAYKMAYVLHVLQIPCEILGFTTTAGMTPINHDRYYGEQFHIVFKAFDEPYHETTIKENFSLASNILHANADADAIAWAHDRLMTKKEKMKALIVLSDGSPAGGRGDIFRATKDVVKHIEETSPIHLIAIGIKDRNVERIYQNRCSVWKDEDLETTVLGLVKDLILQKG